MRRSIPEGPCEGLWTCWGWGGGWGGSDALEGKGPQRRLQKTLDRLLEGVAEAVGGGYCRLKAPSSLALTARETVVRRRLGVLGGWGGILTPF